MNTCKRCGGLSDADELESYPDEWLTEDDLCGCMNSYQDEYLQYGVKRYDFY